MNNPPTPDGYRTRMQLGQDIGEVVSRAMYDLGINPLTVVPLLKPFSHLKENTLQGRIYNFRNGYGGNYLPKLPNEHGTIDKSFDVIKLYQVAHLLNILHIKPEHDIVQKIKEQYPQFEYPPSKERPKTQISPYTPPPMYDKTPEKPLKKTIKRRKQC